MDIKIEVENRLSRRNILEDILAWLEKIGEEKSAPKRNPFGFPLDTAARLQKIFKALVIGSLEAVGEAGKENVFEKALIAIILYPLAAVSLYSFLIVYFLDQALIVFRNTPRD